ncbi:MAG: 16S rRNA (cytosine(1402)-N(4))-methyltransferase RsmH [Candidatus Nanopelagicales bacterium]
MPAVSRPTDERHTPVLLARCLELLAPSLAGLDATVLDATIGMGGHSAAILAAHPRLRLIGMDRDAAALSLAGERLATHRERITLVHETYDQIPAALAAAGVEQVAGVLFDLGVSSLQLDEDERGFAYSRPAPLDMRMDPSTGATAADVLNSYDVRDLERILRNYGDERFARPIARAVVARRAVKAWQESSELVELIRRVLPERAKRHGGNPAKRTFQALRIEVNQELEVLDRAIPAAFGALELGGRLVVMSYHSGEDRIVKGWLRQFATSTAPLDLPVIPEEMGARARVLTRGAEKASEDELLQNPRSAPVRLRAVERIR